MLVNAGADPGFLERGFICIKVWGSPKHEGRKYYEMEINIDDKLFKNKTCKFFSLQ